MICVVTRQPAAASYRLSVIGYQGLEGPLPKLDVGCERLDVGGSSLLNPEPRTVNHEPGFPELVTFVTTVNR